jgi:hypothetical protein
VRPGTGPALQGVVRTERATMRLAGLDGLGAPPTAPPRCVAGRLVLVGAAGATTRCLATEADLDGVALVAGTRLPEAYDVPGTGRLVVVGRLAARALGPSDGWWEPGTWHDELAVGVRRFRLDALDPRDVRNLHTISVVRGPDEVWGTFELLVLGPHPSAGLHGFTDGAPADRLPSHAGA